MAPQAASSTRGPGLAAHQQYTSTDHARAGVDLLGLLHRGLFGHLEAGRSDKRVAPPNLAQPISPSSPHSASQAPFELWILKPKSPGKKPTCVFALPDVQISVSFQPVRTPPLASLAGHSPHPVAWTGLGCRGDSNEGGPLPRSQPSEQDRHGSK